MVIPSLSLSVWQIIRQWVREFHTWAPSFRVGVFHESSSQKTPKEQLARQISQCSESILLVRTHFWIFM